MDTILFFCKKKGIPKPVIEPIGMRTHLLIRIFLDVEWEEWFGVKLECETPEAMISEREKGKEGRAKNGASNKSIMQSVRKLLGFFDIRGRIEKKRWQRQQEREYARLLQEHEKMLEWIEEAVQKLAFDILEMTVGWKDCFCVYEDCVRKVLVGKERNSCAGREDNLQKSISFDKEHILCGVWGKYFRIEEFQRYTQRLWVEEVLARAVLPHFVILGMAPCLPDIIEKYAHKMKSLRWILPENEYSQEIQEFMEDFYTEYGLAIMPLVVPAGQRRIQAVCTDPSNILDFTQEVQRHFRQTAKGSIWLDMLSIEDKRRRCDMCVAYFSLKEKWKAVRKKEPFMPSGSAGVKTLTE